MTASSIRRKRKPSALLPGKLLQIRHFFNESQNGILRKLGLEDEFERDYVSKWERGVMEPPLHVLCAYADLANIYLDVLVRDSVSLPSHLPSQAKRINFESGKAEK